MADENKVLVPEDLKEIVIDFADMCRFCLSETKSGISVNDKCVYEESSGLEGDSIYDIMIKLKFIKMQEGTEIFPSQVCKECFQLVQLCYNFSQVCRKSENLLIDHHMNKTKQTIKTESKVLITDHTSQEHKNCLSDSNPQSLQVKLIAVDEINKIKRGNLEWKLRDSTYVLDNCKQKYNLLSDRLKKPLLIYENSKSDSEQFAVTCSQCLLKFSSLNAFNLHVATHGQKPMTKFKFQCKSCPKSFRTQYTLRKHYKLIHKIKVADKCLINKEKVKNGKKLFCFHCIPLKEFQSEEELVLHMDDCHPNELNCGSKLYVCAYCNDFTSPSRVSMNEHLLMVHKLKEDDITWNDLKQVSQAEDSKPPQAFVCTNPNESQCDSQTTELSSMLEVLNSVVDSLSVAQQGKGFRIICKNCTEPSEFTSANDFAQHIRTHHDESKLLENWVNKNVVWNCSECPAKYSRKQTLCHHLKEKHNKSFEGRKCPEPDCQETFQSNRQLIQHGISVHQKYFAYFHKVFKKILQPDAELEENRVKNFECDICQRKYSYKSSLRKHILTTHLGKSLKDSAVCPYCGKTISSKLNLKSHIEFVHEALFVSCPICKKKINFRTIGKHYKTHKTIADDISSKNSFLCNLCGRILKSKRSFEDHQKLHRNIRDELCDICGSGFTTKKFLRLHKKTHEGSQRKSFGCHQCDKVFSGRHTLNRHLLTHSGKKNFICEICSKCFYTLQELNRHVRYHKKEYRFDCQLCEMRFLDKSRFRNHMMRHRNVRPHKCQFCDKMFIVRGKMNLHMATKHNFEVPDTKGVWKDPKTYVPLDDLL